MKATVEYLSQDTGCVMLTDEQPTTDGHSYSLVLVRGPGYAGKLPDVFVIHRGPDGEEIARRTVKV